MGIFLYLVGGFNPSEKYWSVGIIIPNIWKNKKCSKPPTKYCIAKDCVGYGSDTPY